MAVSHVQFVNGFRVDLKELSKMTHEVGALLFVDAIQSLGAVKVDVREFGIDAMSAGGYKWLCGPIGTGLLYVKKEIIEEINPAYRLPAPGFRRYWSGVRKGLQKSFKDRQEFRIWLQEPGFSGRSKVISGLSTRFWNRKDRGKDS